MGKASVSKHAVCSYVRSCFFPVILLLPASLSGDYPGQQSESPAQTPSDIGIEYLDKYYKFLFLSSNQECLRARMRTLANVFDARKMSLDPFRQSDELRRQTLNELVLSGYIAPGKTSVKPEPGARILEPYKCSPDIHETDEVAHWFKTKGVVFDNLLASDRADSLAEVVAGVVDDSLTVYRESPDTEKDLAAQLANILIDMHELSWHEQAVYLIGFKMDGLQGGAKRLLYLESALHGLWKFWQSSEVLRQQRQELASVFVNRKNKQVIFISIEPIVTFAIMIGYLFPALRWNELSLYFFPLHW